MKMPRATDADQGRFRPLVADGQGVEVKPTFGQPRAFLNGTMATLPPEQES